MAIIITLLLLRTVTDRRRHRRRLIMAQGTTITTIITAVTTACTLLPHITLTTIPTNALEICVATVRLVTTCRRSITCLHLRTITSRPSPVSDRAEDGTAAITSCLTIWTWGHR